MPTQRDRLITVETLIPVINDSLSRIEATMEKHAEKLETLSHHHHSSGAASTNGGASRKARAIKRGGIVGSVGVGGYALLEVLRALLGI